MKFSHNHRPYATADANSAGFPMCVCAKKRGRIAHPPYFVVFGCVLCRGVAVVVIQESISFSPYLGQFLARLSLSHLAKVTVNRVILRNGLLLLCNNLAIALMLRWLFGLVHFPHIAHVLTHRDEHFHYEHSYSSTDDESRKSNQSEESNRGKHDEFLSVG